MSLFIAILEHTFITSCDSTIFRIAELELYFVRFIKIVGFFGSDENLFWGPTGEDRYTVQIVPFLNLFVE